MYTIIAINLVGIDDVDTNVIRIIHIALLYRWFMFFYQLFGIVELFSVSCMLSFEYTVKIKKLKKYMKWKIDQIPYALVSSAYKTTKEKFVSML